MEGEGGSGRMKDGGWRWRMKGKGEGGEGGMKGGGWEVDGGGGGWGWRVKGWREEGGGWMVERVQMFNGTSTAHDFLVAKGVFLHS